MCVCVHARACLSLYDCVFWLIVFFLFFFCLFCFVFSAHRSIVLHIIMHFREKKAKVLLQILSGYKIIPLEPQFESLT